MRKYRWLGFIIAGVPGTALKTPHVLPNLNLTNNNAPRRYYYYSLILQKKSFQGLMMPVDTQLLRTSNQNFRSQNFKLGCSQGSWPFSYVVSHICLHEHRESCGGIYIRTRLSVVSWRRWGHPPVIWEHFVIFHTLICYYCKYEKKWMCIKGVETNENFDSIGNETVGNWNLEFHLLF